MRVGIVGGGLAGMALARFLEQKGIDYVVFEKREEWGPNGYGIGIRRNGVKMLKELGLAETVSQNGTTLDEFHICRSGEEKIFSYTPSREYSELPIAVRREDLHKALRSNIPDRCMRMGTEVEQITSENNLAKIVFSDESTACFDVVVGADGVNSTVRNQCFEDWKLIEKGIIGWAFWVSKGAHIPDKTTYILGDSKIAFIANVSERGLVFIANNPGPKEGLDLPERPLLEDTAKQLGGNLPEIVAAVKDSELFCDTLKTVQCENSAKNRVVLIGDAAHTLNPISALGASLALEDAYSLSQELDSSACIDNALENYAKHQRKRIKPFRRQTRIFEFLAFTRIPLFNTARHFILKHASRLIGPYIGIQVNNDTADPPVQR